MNEYTIGHGERGD